ncbi:hypothetical protein CBL_11520 [Carabus blaptoides fortunei]
MAMLVSAGSLAILRIEERANKQVMITDHAVDIERMNERTRTFRTNQPTLVARAVSRRDALVRGRNVLPGCLAQFSSVQFVLDCRTPTFYAVSICLPATH